MNLGGLKSGPRDWSRLSWLNSSVHFKHEYVTKFPQGVVGET